MRTPQSLTQRVLQPGMQKPLRAFSLIFTSLALLISSVKLVMGLMIIPVLPCLFYVFSIYLVATRSPWISHRRLLIIQPYFLIPAILPVIIHSPPSSFNHLFQLVVIFLSCLICHGEFHQIYTQSREQKSLLRYAAGGGAVAVIFFSVTALFLPGAILLGIALVLAALLRSTHLSMELEEEVSLPKEWPYYFAGGLLFLRIIFFLLHKLSDWQAPLTGLMVVSLAVFLTWFYHQVKNQPLLFGQGFALAFLVNLLPLGALTPISLEGTFLTLLLTPELLTLICAVTLCFCIKSPILVSADTKYGFVMVFHNRLYNTVSLYVDRIHQGFQYRSPEARRKPTAYFTPTTPIGQILTSLPDSPEFSRLAVIGLGTGTLAAYGKPGQSIDFYEINPVIQDIATNPDYFTFLSDSAANINITLGDARRTLPEAEDSTYGVIIGDAYTGDKVETPFLTYEAFSLYLRKLSPHGMLALQITNDDMDYRPYIARLADAHHLVAYAQYCAAETSRWLSDKAIVPKDGSSLLQDILTITHNRMQKGKHFIEEQLKAHGLLRDFVNRRSNHWVVIARSEQDLAFITSHNPAWEKLTLTSETILWTDEAIGYNKVEIVEESA